MAEIIITDLTRFQRDDWVCTAGIELTTGRCIRPMPYLLKSDFGRLNPFPGAILSGDFNPASKLEGPHQEDMDYKNLSFIGYSRSDAFRLALEVGLYNCIEEGFDIHLPERQKYIPLNHDVKRSIITIQVNPKNIKVIEDSYKPGKLKLNFVDKSGKWFSYLPITDLGFHNYSMKKFKSNNLEEINNYINSQDEAYLRIGLSRAWSNGTVLGYWIQANGIYTFPGFLEELRCY